MLRRELPVPGPGPAHRVDASGNVVVQAKMSNLTFHTYLVHDGELAELATPSGEAPGAHAIGPGGQVAGWVAGSGPCNEAFLYRNGEIIRLGTLGGECSDA